MICALATTKQTLHFLVAELKDIKLPYSLKSMQGLIQVWWVNKLKKVEVLTSADLDKFGENVK